MVRASQQILHAPLQGACDGSHNTGAAPGTPPSAATCSAMPTGKPNEDLALDSWGAASLMARSVDSGAHPPQTHASGASSCAPVSRPSSRSGRRKKQPIMARLTSLLKSSKRKDGTPVGEARPTSAGGPRRTDSREGEASWDAGSNSNMSVETTPVRAKHSGGISPMHDRMSPSASMAANTNALTSEPRVALEDPERFVLRGGSADMAWERDMYVHGSAYSQWANCGVRWFLLQHEAAAALRLGMKLAL